MRMDGIQDVGNVAQRTSRPEYNLCDGSDLVLKEDGEEIANAEDKSEEGDTEQDDVMGAKNLLTHWRPRLAVYKLRKSRED